MSTEPEYVIYERPDQADARLSRIGLDRDRLRKAIEIGEAERRTCTANDPRILRGVLPWGRRIRALRELYSPSEGWAKDEPSGLPLLVHAERNIAVTVETGDERTGRPGQPPRTKHAKGPVLQEYVLGHRQLALFGDDGDEEVEELPDIWILLTHRDRNGTVYSELSRPTSQSGVDSRVTFAGERIILEPISPAPSPMSGEDGEEDDGFEVAVERR